MRHGGDDLTGLIGARVWGSAGKFHGNVLKFDGGVKASDTWDRAKLVVHFRETQRSKGVYF